MQIPVGGFPVVEDLIGPTELWTPPSTAGRGVETMTVANCAAGTGPGVAVAVVAVADSGTKMDCEDCREVSDGPRCAMAGIGGGPVAATIGCKADVAGASWATGTAWTGGQEVVVVLDRG